MNRLLDLPAPVHFETILAPIVGDDDGQGGLTGVVRVLDGFDVDALAEQTRDRLDVVVSDELTAGLPAGEVAGLRDRMGAVLETVAIDPEDLLRDLSGQLAEIRQRMESDMEAGIRESLAVLERLRGDVPTDSEALLERLNPAMETIKAELISGGFGQLRAWSEQVEPLADELQILAHGGRASLPGRIVTWVSRKIDDLVDTLLPDGPPMTTGLVAALERLGAADPGTLVDEQISHYLASVERLRARFEAGDLTALGSLSDAEDALTAVVDLLESTVRDAGPAVELKADRLEADLNRRLEAIRNVELVDLGAVGDAFASAIEAIRAQVEAIDLDAVAETIRAPLERLVDTADQVGLERLARVLDELEGRIDVLIGDLEGGLLEVVAGARVALVEAGESLRDVTDVVGEFTEDGTFRFHVEEQVREYLDNVQDGLNQTVRPIMEEFRGSVGQTLSAVEEGLADVERQVEDVLAELRETLAGAAARIEELDLEGRIGAAEEEIRAMLDELGAVDFHIVFEPVIAEIDQMRSSLQEIDVSSLNDVLRDALDLAVDVVIEIDFTTDIADVLLEAMDDILEPPTRALDELEDALEQPLARIQRLDPEDVLAPLDGLFAPINDALGNIQLDSLSGPLEEWREQTLARLSDVAPRALLEPLEAHHRALLATVDALDPAELSAPIEQMIRTLLSELDDLDPSAPAEDFGEALADFRSAIRQLDPETLLAPATATQAKVLNALDSFEPTGLLEPFVRLFEPLESALDELGDEHVDLLETALEPLVSLPERLDPPTAFASVRDAASETAGVLRDLRPAEILGRLQPGYTAMLAAVDPAALGASARTRLLELNPIRHEALTRASTELSSMLRHIENELATVQPSDSLAATHGTVADEIRALVPVWAQEEITAESLGRAIRSANPIAIEDEVGAAWQALIDRLHALDPASLVDPLSDLLDRIDESLERLSPEAVVEAVRRLLDRVETGLRELDLSPLTNELAESVADVRAIVVALDPGPAIERLDETAAALVETTEALDPGELLQELEGILQAVRELVAAFDPAALREPLEDVFEPVRKALAAVDAGAVLSPIVDELNELRDSLAAGLDRTGSAFNDMLAAIPTVREGGR